MRIMSYSYCGPSLLSLLQRSSSSRLFSRFTPSLLCANMNEYVERKVCQLSDIPPNEMKEFTVEDGKVLLINRDNNLFATGTKCSHYGAPLVKGALYKNQLRCPWHGACFNIETGDIEDFPGFNNIPSYQVTVKDQEVWIRAKLSELQQNSCRLIKQTEVTDSQVFIVVGSGAAGFECCNTLRNEGFKGKIILITADDTFPYDRTKLSKSPGSKVESLWMRPEEYYLKSQIDVKTNLRVEKLKHYTREIVCSDGSTYKFNKIFLATGVKPRRFYLSGSDLKNIFYLRTHKDGNQIAEVANGKDVVIVGTSFIGMELASFLNGKASSVSVIGRSNVPFRHIFGQEIGTRVKKLYETHGVKLYLKSQVKRFIGENGVVTGVNIGSEVLKADVVLIGIGTEPECSYLDETKVSYAFYNNIVVNEKLETALADVYAGGDLVAFPLTTFNNKLLNVGHWQIAQLHGKIAALNMLGKEAKVHTVPFFWSSMFGKSLRVAGYTDVFDDLYIHGSLEDLNFVGYYFKNNIVAEVVTIGKDPVASMFAALTTDGKTLSKEEIKRDPTAWVNRIKPNFYPK